jgi:hypothetical protein
MKTGDDLRSAAEGFGGPSLAGRMWLGGSQDDQAHLLVQQTMVRLRKNREMH